MKVLNTEKNNNNHFIFYSPQQISNFNPKNFFFFFGCYNLQPLDLECDL